MDESVAERTHSGDDAGVDSNLMTLLLGAASMVMFLLGLLVTESVGEMGLDIDLKPFFLPYLLIAVSRYGIPTLSISLGAAIGEGILDVSEGYELDDPVGFIGYVIGFTAFGWYVNEVADDSTARRSLAIGAILGGSVQAVFEGLAFLIFESSATGLDGILSVLGNTITHGIILGAVPLLLLIGPVRNQLGPRVQ